MKKAVEEFEAYLPELTRRDDFDEFWQGELAISKSTPLNAEFTPYDYPVESVVVQNLWYDGTDDTRVEALYVKPANATAENKSPLICHFHGYSGNCGMPRDYIEWVSLGYAVMAVSCRNQSGHTYDRSIYHSGAEHNITHGILDKNEYYFKGVILDCLRLIDVACSLDEINKDLIIVEGGSQGGALSLYVAGLDSRVKHCLCDVPSYCVFEERIRGEHGGVSIITNYIKRNPWDMEKVYETLSYFDVMNFADHITAEVFASVGTKDPVAPPKFFYAAYNRITSKKEIHNYPFCQHEGGSWNHAEKKTKKLAEITKGLK